MKYFLIILSILFLIISCSPKDKLIIAVSKGSGSETYRNYPDWVNDIDKNIEVKDLYSVSFSQAVEIIREADGLILSGGPDVHPREFGRAEDSARCSIDLKRDSLEFRLIEIAKEREMPILGICRGMQILNVAFGGSLIIDIPDDTDSEVIHQIEEGDAYHNVTLDTNSYLFQISKTYKGEVNSNHHQAIDKLASEFSASAVSADGLVEAMEYKDFEGNAWLIAVTWHPERLPRNHSLSEPIGKNFVQAAKKFKTKNKQ